MSRRGRWFAVVVLLAAITTLHLVTGTGNVLSHNVFRRLYYLPIIVAAFTGGWRGGAAHGRNLGGAVLPARVLDAPPPGPCAPG